MIIKRRTKLIIIPTIAFISFAAAALISYFSDMPVTQLADLGTIEIDLRGHNLSGFDMSAYGEELNFVDFDTFTIWPSSLPSGFNPVATIERGKNPGLDVRQLHERGIDGSGINIAIIDQALLLEHIEYRDKLMLYELLNNHDGQASMHGPAVASIAVGDSIGVAPGAKLYYIASTFGRYGMWYNENLKWMAEGIYRVLEINEHLPEDDKIRVISISRGFSGNDGQGGSAVYEAIEAAKKQVYLSLRQAQCKTMILCFTD
jgi:hypothetical protein